MTEDSEDVTSRVTEDEVVELVEKLYGLKVSNLLCLQALCMFLLSLYPISKLIHAVPAHW